MALSAHITQGVPPLPKGATALPFFMQVLTRSPTSPGEMAEIVKLLRMYVRDTVLEATLRAHAVGATREKQIE